MWMWEVGRGIARGGDMGACLPHHGLKKNYSLLQTDDYFATGVTRQTLLILVKPKENVQFQRWFFENFPQTSILGRNPPPSALRHLTPLGTFGPSIVVSTPYKNAGYAPGSWYSSYNICVGQTVLFEDVI